MKDGTIYYTVGDLIQFHRTSTVECRAIMFSRVGRPRLLDSTEPLLPSGLMSFHLVGPCVFVDVSLRFSRRKVNTKIEAGRSDSSFPPKETNEGAGPMPTSHSSTSCQHFDYD